MFLSVASLRIGVDARKLRGGELGGALDKLFNYLLNVWFRVEDFSLFLAASLCAALLRNASGYEPDEFSQSQTRTPPRRAALKRLITRSILVAGAGFEPAAFRL